MGIVAESVFRRYSNAVIARRQQGFFRKRARATMLLALRRLPCRAIIEAERA